MASRLHAKSLNAWLRFTHKQKQEFRSPTPMNKMNIAHSDCQKKVIEVVVLMGEGVRVSDEQQLYKLF